MDDLEAIKRLKARYFRALDSKDWDAYAGVFAEDCIVDLTLAGGGKYHGRNAFRAYGSSLKIVQSVHHGHMPEIDLTGPDSAAGLWGLGDYNIWEDGTQNHGWGHYLETYVKRDGRWYIKTMALSYLRVETICTQPALIAGKDGTAHLRGDNPAAAYWS
ncbi:MAG TPA: nuclear transport factor 2 family protein [Sphingobium sp.]|uniref:nuclear transport factor 2 family protein n=1 Tax=Sphingobium sp. TaxID=1912891 RepID=UPI002ED5D9D0